MRQHGLLEAERAGLLLALDEHDEICVELASLEQLSRRTRDRQSRALSDQLAQHMTGAPCCRLRRGRRPIRRDQSASTGCSSSLQADPA